MFAYLYEDVRTQLIEMSRPAAKRMRFTSVVPKPGENSGGRSKTLKGDMYLAQLRNVLNTELGLTRSSVQVLFHESFLCSIGRFLYSTDPDVDMTEVMVRNKWDTLKQQVLCMTPRRFGKLPRCFVLKRARSLTHASVTPLPR